ncbi:HK97-gp10 family putative phage morphogenesis protein [Singulisphaera sp. PoT]|uniref:HK97-gp10 family putative phage morphogenesis protein n=1 Tax=Singulisphaera sp. PoT TaxID=3411797 RepID=UPI003BF4A97B
MSAGGGSVNWFGDRVQKHLIEAIGEKMRRAGEAAAQEARSLAPARTGTLQSSIGYSYDESSRTLRVSVEAPYAAYVELGTRNMPARPFLRPALEAIAREFGGSVAVDLGSSPQVGGGLKGARKRGRGRGRRGR